MKTNGSGAQRARRKCPHMLAHREDLGALAPPPRRRIRKNEVFFSHTLDKSSKFRYSSRPALQNAAVAQLDRVSGYEPEGRGFESCQPRHFSTGRKLVSKEIGLFFVALKILPFLFSPFFLQSYPQFCRKIFTEIPDLHIFASIRVFLGVRGNLANTGAKMFILPTNSVDKSADNPPSPPVDNFPAPLQTPSRRAGCRRQKAALRLSTEDAA